jgi:hypothetical protein
MNYFTLLCLAAFFLLALFLNKKEKREKIPPSDEDNQPPVEDFPDLNDIFLSNAEGKDILGLVKVSNQQDKMILRSILDAEGIETYIEPNHFSGLYPTHGIHRGSSLIIFIYKSKAAEAKKVVEDYILTLKEGRSSEKANPLDRALKTGAMLSGVLLPEPDNSLPELLI